MDSGRRKAAADQAGWADLPVELLVMVSGHVRNTSEIVRFRSVCRSWRSSTAPPPNKLSPSFPLKAPFFGGKSSEFFWDCGHVINVCALYLVRPRSDPSKAWIVSVQESAAGKLVLRHGLTYQEINGDAGLDLDENRIAATQNPIAGFYAHNYHCKQCKGVKFTRKVVFVSKTSSSSSSGCGQLVGLCSFPECNVLVGLCSCPELIPFAFRLDLGRGILETTHVKSEESHLIFQDSVKFNGRIFTVDWQGYIWVLDHTNLQLVRITEKPVREDIGVCINFKFVVSDGDLYVVWLSYWDPSACEIYRLVVVTAGNDDKCSGISIEQVRDLGERVFFITYQCSFSISARLLPHPWQEGNCIFISDFPNFNCRCARCSAVDDRYRVLVFYLGSQTFTKLWTKDGHPYSELFSPPVSRLVFSTSVH